MNQTHEQPYQGLLKSTLVPAMHEEIAARIASGELAWCSFEQPGCSRVAAGSLSHVELLAAPEHLLAPGYESCTWVSRLARLGIELDPSGGALSIIHNSLVLSGINIGPVAKRREEGRAEPGDLEHEASVEAIIWAAALSNDACTAHLASSRMASRLPWARQECLSVVHVCHEAVNAHRNLLASGSQFDFGARHSRSVSLAG